ncbi:hypothetical protein GCM10009827_012350 [Dactylosporangium maewongense]|uniref:Uncharacterized protein n=1 Tax=Dactylosporangium maewongense TaxID=634393 RepID=A0ABN1ZPH0_9ACTN
MGAFAATCDVEVIHVGFHTQLLVSSVASEKVLTGSYYESVNSDSVLRYMSVVSVLSFRSDATGGIGRVREEALLRVIARSRPSLANVKETR